MFAIITIRLIWAMLCIMLLSNAIEDARNTQGTVRAFHCTVGVLWGLLVTLNLLDLLRFAVWALWG